MSAKFISAEGNSKEYNKLQMEFDRSDRQHKNWTACFAEQVLEIEQSSSAPKSNTKRIVYGSETLELTKRD